MDPIPAAWIQMGGLSFAYTGAAYHSIAFDAQNRAYLAYRDLGNEGRVGVQRWNPSSNDWEPVAGGLVSAGDSKFTSIVLDGSGLPYVAYQCSVAGGKAVVRRPMPDGESWEDVGSAGFSQGIATFPSIAFDSTGTLPYVAFADEITEDDLDIPRVSVYRLNSDAPSGWEAVGPSRFSQPFAGHVTLQMDSSDAPYVSFVDGSSQGGRRAAVMYLAGQEYLMLGSAYASVGPVEYASLVLDTYTSPPTAYVAFTSNFVEGRPASMVTLNDSGDWEYLGGTDASQAVSDGFAKFVSLRLDTCGAPVLAYASSSCASFTVSAQRFAAGAWQYVGTPCFGAQSSEAGIVMGLDNNNVPIVFHSDEEAMLEGFNQPPGIVWRFSNPTCTGGRGGQSPRSPPPPQEEGESPKASPPPPFEESPESPPFEESPESPPFDESPESPPFEESPDSPPPSDPPASPSSPSPESGDENSPPPPRPVAINSPPPPSPEVAQKSWSQAGGSFAPYGADFHAIAFDSQNRAHIAYSDMVDGTNLLAVRRYNSVDNVWEPLGFPAASGSLGYASLGKSKHGAMAISQEDVVYVIYSDEIKQERVTVRRLVAGEWEDVGAAGFSQGTVEYCSLAFSPSGTLYAAFVDRVKEGSLNRARGSVYRLADGAWEEVGTPRFTAAGVLYLTVQVDSQNTPWVAYIDSGTGVNGKATVMRLANDPSGNSVWTPVGQAGFSPDSDYLSFALDRASDTPFVSFQDRDTYRPVVMSFDGESWAQVGGTPASVAESKWSSLQLDSQGRPMVAFVSFGCPSDTPSVLRFTGDAWQTVGPECFGTTADGYGLKMGLDGNDTPYVFQSDEEADANASPGVVWRFA